MELDPSTAIGLTEQLKSLFSIFSTLIGGLVGIYIILVVLRWIEIRQTRFQHNKIIREVRKLDKKIEDMDRKITRLHQKK